MSLSDITKAKIDGIANVITPDLEIRGRLNAAIFKAAGEELDDFILENIIAPREKDTFITPGYNLPAKNIIFSVVPSWRSDLDIIDKHLLDAITTIVEAAKINNIETLGIPLICCGRKGYPLSRGVRLILQGVFESAGPPLKHIEFICDDPDAVRLYLKRLEA